MRCSVMWSLQRSNVRDSASSCSSSLQSQMQLLQTKSRALAHRRAKLVRINYIIYILDRERDFSHANPNTMAHNFHSPVGYPVYLGICVSHGLNSDVFPKSERHNRVARSRAFNWSLRVHPVRLKIHIRPPATEPESRRYTDRDTAPRRSAKPRFVIGAQWAIVDSGKVSKVIF